MLFAVCELMTHEVEVVLRGNQTRPVSEGETLSHSPRLPFKLRGPICLRSGESQKTQTTFATDGLHFRERRICRTVTFCSRFCPMQHLKNRTVLYLVRLWKHPVVLP